ncbi:MAG: zinc-binding metallopeptidase family protein [Gemmataceae bacterium]
MKIFHCDNCEQLVFYENVRCVNCEHDLAYLPDLEEIAALEPAGDNLWYSPAPAAKRRTYRLCQNYRQQNICNWAVPADDPNPLCGSCRLTRVIPDLSQPGHKERWYRLEVAKRRLLYSLRSLGLPLLSKTEHPERGLAFQFLADPDPETPNAAPVLTGHNEGLITINLAEADDAEREKRRMRMHEPYRTLLGHFRHEVGHYYWDRLIQDSEGIEDFRARFGDEREDYGQALQSHYQEGAPVDWQERFLSSYASSHPWEDWAETWAHYLHMTDTLETAITCGLSLRPRRSDEPALKAHPTTRGCLPESFDRLIESWFPLTYVLNNLNRGMGVPDGYPFVLSSPAIAKLRFVHEVVGAQKG